MGKIPIAQDNAYPWYSSVADNNHAEPLSPPV